MPTWRYDPATGDMRSDDLCGLCDRPAVGMASINETVYCHASDQGRSCYETASTALARGRAGDSILAEHFLDGLLDAGPASRWRRRNRNFPRPVTHYQVDVSWPIEQHDAATDAFVEDLLNLLTERVHDHFEGKAISAGRQAVSDCGDLDGPGCEGCNVMAGAQPFDIDADR